VPAKTVRVRVAVAVNELGHWAAAGWHGPTEVELTQEEEDRDARSLALEGLADGQREAVVFVEADVPLPGNDVVEGRLAS
jgi:hypothetical protein